MPENRNPQSMKLVGHRTAFDPSLSAALSDEKEALLDWLIEGTFRWRGKSSEKPA